jgi:hypothetical protein
MQQRKGKRTKASTVQLYENHQGIEHDPSIAHV